MSKQINIPNWMIIDSVRYAIGRATYQVAITTEWLIKNWDDLPLDTQDIIRHDVEDGFRRYNSNPRALGHQCDKESWESVRKLWVNQESDYE